jgi:hypothetical protein
LVAFFFVQNVFCMFVRDAQRALNAGKSGERESSQLRLTLAEDAVAPIRQSSLLAKASLQP